MRVAGPLLAAFITLSGGCSFGPKAIESSHGRYTAAIQRVDEEQFLRNIVRLRYVETPMNLAVVAVAAQYELSASVEARPFFSTEGVTGPFFRSFTSILPFASFGGAVRPTVSLSPQDDGTAVRRFMTPISADTLVFLTQAGFPVSDILRVWVEKLNGVPNFVPIAPAREAPADFERFRRACELLQIAQDRELILTHDELLATEVSGPLPASAITAAAAVEAAKGGFEYRPQDGGKTWVLVKQERRLVVQVNPSGQGSPEVAELMGLLNLRPGSTRYEVIVASGVPDPLKNPSEPSIGLRVTPRSTMQAFFFLSNGVEVPPEHLACGLAQPPHEEATRGLIRVRSCAGHQCAPPACAFVAVWHRGYWFFIDDRDRESKATLLLMLELRRLDFNRQQIGLAPALTLPVGR